MKVFEYLDRISMMHKLVSRQRTGTPEEFARQLGVSRTSLYELIDELRSRGAPIAYSKTAKTFFYRQPYDLSLIHTSEPTRLGMISYAVFCLKKKNQHKQHHKRNKQTTMQYHQYVQRHNDE